MSLIEASEDKTPSTAPIETLVASEDSAFESRLARMPLSSSAARAGGQSGKKRDQRRQAAYGNETSHLRKPVRC